MTLFKLLKYTWQGHSVTRAFLNDRLETVNLEGRTLDLGSGKDTAYLDFVPRADNCTYEVYENKLEKTIDFEIDSLPYDNQQFDTVILLNVLEHIFNFSHLMKETHRITKVGGKMIGFTPFLMRYHGDPHDYFRYTDEALEKILTQAGWGSVEVEPVGMGPFMASAHQFSRSFPKILRELIVIKFYLLDKIFIALRPRATSQYVLGYYFETRK